MILTAEISGANTNNETPCSTAYMSVSLNNSGSFDANSLRSTGDIQVRASITVLITNLTPGASINFSARYKNIGCLGADGLGARFNARQIILIPN